METDGKLVSVVVPVYNVDKYLNICVDSILVQTYTNIEIILSDDGSTDDSGNICDKYEKIDNRVRVIHGKNAGLSEARNRGIDVARGEYICFIDSDDYVKRTYIEYLITLISKYDADISICPFIRDYSGTIKEPKIKCKDVCLSAKEAFDLIFTKRRDVGIYAWNKMYKRSLFHNVRYPQGKFFEDSGTTYKLISQCNIIVYGDIPQYYYRVDRKGAITNTALKKENKRYKDKIHFLNEMERYFVHHPQVFSKSFYNMYLGDLLIIYPNIDRKEEIDLCCELEKSLDSHMWVLNQDISLTRNVRIKIWLYKMNKKLYRLIF